MTPRAGVRQRTARRDLGRYDSYFMSRSQIIDISSLVKHGDNLVAVRLESSSARDGFMLDGLAHSDGNQAGHFQSDATWRQIDPNAVWPPEKVPADAQPVLLLRGPSHRYMGDLSSLYLYRRPHPLPGAGWLEPSNFTQLWHAQPEHLDWAMHADRGEVVWLPVPDSAGCAHAELVHGSTKHHAWVDGQRPFGYYDEWGVVNYQLPNPDATSRWFTLRLEALPGQEEGAALGVGPRFGGRPGRITLGDWRERGLPTIPARSRTRPTWTGRRGRAMKSLLRTRRVRGTAEVFIQRRVPPAPASGVPTSSMSPRLVRPGRNTIRIIVANTLGPYMKAESPTHHVFEQQDVSGLFGPVRLIAERIVRIEAK